MSPLPFKHTYWSLFKKGLQGDDNLFKAIISTIFHNPFIMFLVMITIISSSVTVHLSKMIPKLETLSSVDAILILTGICFIPYIVRFTKQFGFTRINNVDMHICKEIKKYINHTVRNPPQDKYKLYQDTNDLPQRFQYEQRINWSYQNVVNEIVNMTTQTIKTLILMFYMCVGNAWILLIIIPGYAIIYKFVLPKMTLKEKDRPDMRDKYAQAHGSHVMDDWDDVNPAGVLEEYRYVDASLDIITAWNPIRLKRRFRDILFELSQDSISYCLMIYFVTVKDWGSLILILFNRSTLFELMNIYTRMIKKEQEADETLGGTFKFLDRCYGIEPEKKEPESDDVVIDITEEALLLPSDTIPSDQTEGSTWYNIRQNSPDDVVDITIFELNYEFTKPRWENNIKIDSPASLHLPKVNIPITPGVVLIDGQKGCGKSILASIFAGEGCDGNVCEYVQVTHRSGKVRVLDNEFTDLKKERYYICQDTAAYMVYGGSIKITPEKLFPGMDIYQIRDMLDSFGVGNKTPASIKDTFPKKLSGGERQTIAVASCLARALQNIPQFIIGDELGKALDQASAIGMIDWLLDNYQGTLFLITHHDKLKNYLMGKPLVLNKKDDAKLVSYFVKRGVNIVDHGKQVLVTGEKKIIQKFTFEGEFETEVVVE